ncbi:MAG: NADH-quinone oxidoreductase subunit J [Lacunisphaera sp.]|nr:NADH-quinone oxidoreductase subunit J [Lacunisphaera sp.]
MTTALILIAILLLGSAAAAMLRRNLIHSALLLIASWAGVAAFYLWAGAEFVAFAQVLIYVGAISMVVLFAVLLTRQNPVAELPAEPASRMRALTGITVAVCTAAILSAAILSSKFTPAADTAPQTSVKQIGLELMHRHGTALLIVGVILTVALLGATILAATDAKEKPEDRP